MKICVIGTGYVGLVAGACFSDSGNHVSCLDVNQEKIDRLNKGEIPIYEPGLEEIVEFNMRGGRLRFTTDAAESIGSASVIFLAVGTPQGDDGSSDLKYLYAALETVRENIRRDVVVVCKSTVPVGTSDEVRRRLEGVPHSVHVVSNPEFLKEGTAIDNFLRPERVIIGSDSQQARDIMAELYAPFTRSGNPVLFMDNRSAEMAKYAANTFLAMKISFINDMAKLAEKVGANIQDVRTGIVTDSRIGNKFLYPGCGYGGSCFPKDVLSLIHLGEGLELQLPLFRAIHEINEKQKTVIFHKIKRHFDGNLSGKTAAVWGLSFKPRTDDMREAPSVTLIDALLEAGVKVKAYDPVASHEARRIYGNKIELTDNAYDAVAKSDFLAIMTEWNEFRSPDFDALAEQISSKAIFDGRNLYSAKSLSEKGFHYYCIGRPDPK